MGDLHFHEISGCKVIWQPALEWHFCRCVGMTMYGACYRCQLWRKGPEAKSVCVGALNELHFGSGL